MRVADCSLAAPPVLLPVASVSAASRLLALHNATHAVVVEGARLMGIVSRRTIMAAHPSSATSLTHSEIRARLDQIRVGDIMLPDPLVVSPATPLAEAVRLLRDARASVLVVSDREGVVGLITANDLLRALDQLVDPRKPGKRSASAGKWNATDAAGRAAASDTSGLDRIEHR